MQNILIINGPNLNLLGEREKDKYGSSSYEDIKKNCILFSKKHNINLSFFQSNVEGEIVNEIQNARNKQNCIIIMRIMHLRYVVAPPIMLSLFKSVAFNSRTPLNPAKDFFKGPTRVPFF